MSLVPFSKVPSKSPPSGALAEQMSKSADFNSWGSPVVLRAEVPLVTVEGKGGSVSSEGNRMSQIVIGQFLFLFFLFFYFFERLNHNDMIIYFYYFKWQGNLVSKVIAYLWLVNSYYVIYF